MLPPSPSIQLTCKILHSALFFPKSSWLASVRLSSCVFTQNQHPLGPPQNIWVRKEGAPQENPALLLPPFPLQGAEFHQPVQLHEPNTQGPAAASSNPGTKRGPRSPSRQLKYLKTGNHKSFPAKQLYLLI